VCGFSDVVALEEGAIRQFYDSELVCHRTNLRLDPLLYGRSDPTYDDRVTSFVDVARKKIVEWIGSGPSSSFEGKFGPGATMSDSSRFCTVPDKMSSVPTFTPNALFHLVPWSGTLWATACAALGTTPVTVKGNAFFTVPKDASKLRGCCKEPALNGFYQLGVGSMLRRRLATAGFDLTHGQDVHREVARRSSLHGGFCTIDLSSASDTVCKALVKLLLPEKWFELMDSLRSPKTLVNGKWVYLEKFSSMGNGFTFELETLLFASICYACDPALQPGEDLFVYGDDIIVPARLAEDVLAALRFFGFSPNKRKTFTEGWFRESCGGDYFRGVRVRPHNMKSVPSSPEDFITLANGLRRACFNGDRLSDFRWGLLRRSWFEVLNCIPTQVRSCRGPEALGDIVIHDLVENWSSVTRNCIRYFRGYIPVRFRRRRWSDFSPSVQLAAAVYGVHRDPMGNLIPRNSVEGYAIRLVPWS
jgi:hypothetical protein